MRKNKRKVYFVLLVLLLMFVSIGYAYLNSTLNITGASTINNPTWDIHWENIVVKPGSVSASTPTIDTNKTTVTYSVNLVTPGDFYEFTVDAVNAGSIDGMVSVISNKLNDVEITTLPNYLEYSISYYDDIEVEQNHLLAAGTSEKYKVHVGYKKNISQSDLPTNTQTFNFTFAIIYVQKDNNAVKKPRTIITVSDTSNNIGSTIPTGVTTYTNYNDAITTFGHPFFLRHILDDNNKIIESYVGFVVDNNAYYIKGNDSTYYETNRNTLLNAFGSSNCIETTNALIGTYTECNLSGLYVRVPTDGDIDAKDDSLDCGVHYRGSSECSEFLYE